MISSFWDSKFPPFSHRALTVSFTPSSKGREQWSNLIYDGHCLGSWANDKGNRDASLLSLDEPSIYSLGEPPVMARFSSPYYDHFFPRTFATTSSFPLPGYVARLSCLNY